MRKKMLLSIVCLIAGLVVFSGCSFGTKKFEPEALMALTAQDLDLEEVSLGELIRANEVTMLNI